MTKRRGMSLVLAAVVLLGFSVPVGAQAEVHWSVASAPQSPQAQKVVACIIKSLGGKPAKRAERRWDKRPIAPVDHGDGTALSDTASVVDQITIPQGTRDYYAISYFEFPGGTADVAARRVEALNGKFAGSEPMVFQSVRAGPALALVKTPEMRKAPPDEMPAIAAKVEACMKASWR